MEISISKKVPVNVKYVKFDIPVYLEAFNCNANDLEEIKTNFDFVDADLSNEFQINGIVNIDTGKFENWTQLENEVEIFEKVVDCGVYMLLDENFNEIISYEGYVPSIFECNENGYGDYFNMTISPDGIVNNWSYNMERKIKDFINKHNDF